MNGEQPTGLSDLSLYVPEPSMDLNRLLDYRAEQSPKLDRRLRKALQATGQEQMRFPEPWEDTSTLAAESAYRLLSRAQGNTLSKLRYLSVGTETPVDHSKPVSAYVEGMLQHSGLPVPESLSTFQVQHACAGGTIAMMSVGALLHLSRRSDESGLVICSDIARYEVPSTAEITQGAGAVALHVENNPKLLEIDLDTQGYFSSDVDDFFRPLGSVTAKVKGGYSVQCYHEALDSAFLDHCERRREAPEAVLRGTDMFIVHVPFYRMGITAMHNLLSKYITQDEAEIERFLTDRGFYNGLKPAKHVGNIYSGSAYMALMFQLADRYRELGGDIVGRKLLVASYGSGNTMTVYSMTVAERAPEVIASWDLDAILNGGRDAEISEYESWLEAPLARERFNDLMGGMEVPNARFYLGSLREDGYREYKFRQ
ncbi:MAG: hydroxymethylglutaryl-CoA synthase family protein [Spirochaetia bacterium]